jgi:hypothetical protein
MLFVGIGISCYLFINREIPAIRESYLVTSGNPVEVWVEKLFFQKYFGSKNCSKTKNK